MWIRIFKKHLAKRKHLAVGSTSGAPCCVRLPQIIFALLALIVVFLIPVCGVNKSVRPAATKMPQWLFPIKWKFYYKQTNLNIFNVSFIEKNNLLKQRKFEFHISAREVISFFLGFLRLRRIRKFVNFVQQKIYYFPRMYILCAPFGEGRMRPISNGFAI